MAASPLLMASAFSFSVASRHVRYIQIWQGQVPGRQTELVTGLLAHTHSTRAAGALHPSRTAPSVCAATELVPSGVHACMLCGRCIWLFFDDVCCAEHEQRPVQPPPLSVPPYLTCNGGESDCRCGRQHDMRVGCCRQHYCSVCVLLSRPSYLLHAMGTREGGETLSCFNSERSGLVQQCQCPQRNFLTLKQSSVGTRPQLTRVVAIAHRRDQPPWIACR